MLESREVDTCERGACPRVDVGTREAQHPEPERDVGEHVAVGEQRVVLEHETEAPVMGRDGREVGAVPRDPTGAGRLETGDGAQEGGLAATARAQHARDAAVGNREAHGVERAGGLQLDRELLDVEHQNSAEAAPRRPSTATIAAAVSAIRTTLAAMAAPKLLAPGWLSRR